MNVTHILKKISLLFIIWTRGRKLFQDLLTVMITFQCTHEFGKHLLDFL